MADLSRTDVLNRRFGISGLAQVISGNGGLPKLQVTSKSASAEIYLHGAQITSWQPAGAEEVIFLSEHSRWEDGRAIRGGIPVCFPWFRAKADDPKAPAHGFVRTRSGSLTP
jgi:glucose-6-phosphate 1-epimerase